MLINKIKYYTKTKFELFELTLSFLPQILVHASFLELPL